MLLTRLFEVNLSSNFLQIPFKIPLKVLKKERSGSLNPGTLLF